MALPLLNYRPTTQNQRVASFGKAELDEDTPYIYRLEDVAGYDGIEEVIWATYRQVMSEHAILKFNRQPVLESQLKNRAISVRDFVRGLAKTERFYETVVAVNDNYRLVEICLKRLLGRDAYNEDEKIAWSIKIGTMGFHGFVDTLMDSEEYTTNFGDNTVPYQRKRMEGRPFNLVTPRYGEDYRAIAGTVKTDWRFIIEEFYTAKAQARFQGEGNPDRYRDMARAVGATPAMTPRVSPYELDYMAKVPSR
jgi:phycobilisome rod-core linker protein